ncbi:MAG TPA: hypothetical protein VIL88_14830 [Devosia sp.]|jgi:hypothetical protein|uniref:hypothetical protein n=1 Tax=Devosia sp. TaxID=1871048 RepID=UPI002F91C46B
MRILYAELVDEPASKPTRCLGTVDLELTPDVRMYGLRLLQMPDGKKILFAPHAGHRRAATFSLKLARTLTAMAIEALGVAANDD